VVLIKVLLLTNRDSDNVGDQIIEACDISIIKLIFRNLGYEPNELKINTRAAGIITKRYLKTLDETLLEDPIRAISASDVVILGGAPLFNYKYQNFYKRTIKTLEIAEEYGVPVIMSGIGVESYDEQSPKCQMLKEALKLSCVRQITTRDNLDSLEKYVPRADILTAKVSDPAVFAASIIEKSEAVTDDPNPKPNPKKVIGLAVTRSRIFIDNNIEFTGKDQLLFWKETIDLLTERGYDYRLFTTGHFSDEVFLDVFAREYAIPANKLGFNVNSPEELVREIRMCDGVIAYRLHANITAYAYGIPSIGLTWNFKVPYFYAQVGYPERAFDHEDWSAPIIVDALEKAMTEGVEINEPVAMTVYNSLFDVLSGIFAKDGDVPKAYTFEQVTESLPPMPQTSDKLYKERVARKLKRTYEKYAKYEDYHFRVKASKYYIFLKRCQKIKKRVLRPIRRIKKFLRGDKNE
jgi:polysaccharide pyruvyl transferase WcaK-like protein